MEDKDFLSSLEHVNVPVLVLDQKWHRLFALNGKPKEVLLLEKEEKNLLERQAELNEEIKDLKTVKNNLRKSVMENMMGAESEDLDPEVRKKRDQDKRLLDETNERLAMDEDELLELPEKLKETNINLMVATMDFCYAKMRKNTQESDEITEWIQKVRIDLKKNIIRKQNREINNKEMYHYMHDLFGPVVLDIFDINDEFNLSFLLEKEEEEKKTEDNKKDDSQSDEA